MNKGDEAFVLNGVFFLVKDQHPETVKLLDKAGFLRAEWDGHRWLFPSAQRPPYGLPVSQSEDRGLAAEPRMGVLAGDS